MIAKPTRCCVRLTRAGLTLIEVIAATLLLGTLLVSILLAYGRHATQIKRAEQQVAVINALNTQIADWYLTRRGVPINESGLLLRTQANSIRWRTRVINDDPILETLLSRKVRVEARAADGDILAYIDILQEATR